MSRDSEHQSFHDSPFTALSPVFMDAFSEAIGSNCTVPSLMLFFIRCIDEKLQITCLRENNEDRTVDYWSAGTVAGSKEHLGTVKKASPSRKEGCCNNTQLAAAVAIVVSPLSSSIITARNVVVEQRPQQYIKHEQYQYRPQFLQLYMQLPGDAHNSW
ncbi:unnamed protein product [Cercopithifilaria johnstoni]|uniref:Uncharacterized protein n=1 Tax=Cercopithifilaria johnstoni TaxID=2874296 RepID=A0A8J2QB92_9BILA|nr:unnamed protein product [Cercopithifilaria johnstoni]